MLHAKMTAAGGVRRGAGARYAYKPLESSIPYLCAAVASTVPHLIYSLLVFKK